MHRFFALFLAACGLVGLISSSVLAQQPTQPDRFPQQGQQLPGQGDQRLPQQQPLPDQGQLPNVQQGQQPQPGVQPAQPGSQPAQPAAQPAQRGARPFLGIMAERAPDAQQQGVLVREVEPASPAFQAGIKNGDLINKVDNRDVRDFDALLNALSQHKAGDKVNLQVLRDGKTQSFDVTLGQRQARRAEEQGARQPTAFLGVQAQELTPEMKKQLGINVDKGVLITSVMPGTPAANAGLRQGDVITSVNDQQIQDPQQLRDAIHQAGVGKEVGLKAMRGQNSMDFKARLEEAPVDFFTPPARP